MFVQSNEKINVKPQFQNLENVRHGLKSKNLQFPGGTLDFFLYTVNCRPEFIVAVILGSCLFNVMYERWSDVESNRAGSHA